MMTGTTFFFVVLGACFAVMNLMRLVELLDTPRPPVCRRARRVQRARRGEADLSAAELVLERTRLAA